MGRQRQSKTDEVLVFPKINYHKQLQVNEFSDHFKICIELEIKVQVNKKQHITVFKKHKAYILNMKASGQKSFEDYLEFVRRNLRKDQVIFKQRVKIPTLNQAQTLQGVLKKVADAFCEQRQRAYKMIKYLKNLNPIKKEGGIFKYFYDDEGEFCCYRVTQNCLDQLSVISNRAPFLPKELPKLQKLSHQEIQKLQESMSSNKAISVDGISHTFLKKTKQYQLIEDLWCNDIVRINGKLGEARFVPLNNFFPQIPTKEQFRPITILSNLQKFLELRFKSKIDEYMEKRMRLRQNGFVKAGGVQINIFQIFKRMQIIKNQDRISLIFIDFSLHICREKLYQILRNKNLMKEKEIQFLEAMHTLIHYIVPESNEIYYFKDGVPQESSLSPGLFNIYLEEFMEEVGRKANIQYDDFEYADDLAVLIKYQYIKPFNRCLGEESMKWDLKVNITECFIIKLKQEKQLGKYIEGIPIVDKYTSLGIIINRQGNLKDHIMKIKQRVNYIVKELRWISQYLGCKERIHLWIAFIRPLFQYLAAVYFNQIQQYKLEISRLYKGSLKIMMRVPKCTSDQIVNQLVKSFNEINIKAVNQIQQKINERVILQSGRDMIGQNGVQPIKWKIGEFTLKIINSYQISWVIILKNMRRYLLISIQLKIIQIKMLIHLINKQRVVQEAKNGGRVQRKRQKSQKRLNGINQFDLLYCVFSFPDRVEQQQQLHKQLILFFIIFI